MEIRVLGPGDEPAVEAFLLPHMAASMFLLGNMRAAGLVDRGEPLCGTYVGAFDQEVLVGVVAHYWNGVLIPQAPVHVETLWREAVNASRRAITGVIGPDGQVSAIRSSLLADADAAGRPLNVQTDEPEKLYRLDLADLVVPEPLQTGAVAGRQAEHSDLEVLAAWLLAYEIESLGASDSPQSRAETRESAARHVDARDRWILEAGGHPVAMSGFNTCITEAVQVGGVYTPPELRSRGYGRCVVAASLLAAREEGVGLGVLFTGEDNVRAQRAYTALGFRHVGAFRMTLLREPWAPEAAESARHPKQVPGTGEGTGR